MSDPTPTRAFELREPCKCGSTSGRIEIKNGQNCAYCARCNEFQYNAPRAEVDRHRDSESLAELTDLYGYPVTVKDDPDAVNDAVQLRIGSDIHKQDAFARLPEGEVRRLRDALTGWLEDR